MAVIEAKNLTKRFGDFTAVDGINFSIESGECFGFLGPNGAGKTTTMSMIYCLSPITSGDIKIIGLTPKKDGAKIKSIIGVVPQNDNLDLELTVEENLIVYSRYFGIGRSESAQRISGLLEFMELEKKRKSKIKELSGGMVRRLVLIRALLNNPKILILDEPTTGLDPQVRHLIWQKLRELKLSGVTMLLTTHYMEEAARLCDRLVIMDRGKILLIGNPQELVDKHTPKFVMEFNLSENGFDMNIFKNRPDCSVEVYDNRCYVYCDSDMSLRKISEDNKISALIIRTSTLEDLFLKLAKRGLNE